MAFGSLEDLSGQVELVVFPDTFRDYESLLKLEEPILVAGALEKDGDTCKILVDKVGRFQEVLAKVTSMCLHVDKGQNLNLELLHEILNQFPGQTPVLMEVDLADVNQTVKMELEKGVRVQPELFESLQQAFGRTDFIELRSS